MSKLTREEWMKRYAARVSEVPGQIRAALKERGA